jgi:hypothetical protein
VTREPGCHHRQNCPLLILSWIVANLILDSVKKSDIKNGKPRIRADFLGFVSGNFLQRKKIEKKIIFFNFCSQIFPK